MEANQRELNCGGVTLCADEDTDVDEAVWHPGVNCGAVLSPGIAFADQARVLIAHILVNLQKLPRELLNACSEALPRIFNYTRHSCGFVEVASRLTCLSTQRLYRCFCKMRSTGFTFDGDVEQGTVSQRHDAPTTHKGGLTQRSNYEALQLIARAALSTSYKIGSAEDFQLHLLRLTREDVDVGLQAHTYSAYRNCLYLGARIVECFGAEGMQQPLGSLGKLLVLKERC